MQLYVLDFDGVYKEQIWRQLLNKRITALHPTESHGVNGYCSPKSEKALTSLMTKIQSPALTFLGSGNYHYLTYLLLQQIHQPFSLVLFDYHSDMQDSLCNDLLSCGNWVKFALKYCTNLKQVFIMGIADKYSTNLGLDIRKEVHLFTEKQLKEDHWVADFKQLIEYPIYLSIDKDVFDSSLVQTNWDQGSLDYGVMNIFFNTITTRFELLGADICGEYPVDYADSHFSECQLNNGDMNRYLLRQLESYQNYQKKKIC